MGFRRQAGTDPVQDVDHPSISSRDRGRTATARGLPALYDALRPLRDTEVKRLLDVGCGFGGVSRAVADLLGADEAHGVDIDPEVLDEATGKRVHATVLDIESQPLPHDDGTFDLVMSLGMLDYLASFDHALSEMHRVLRPGGHVLVSIPNLGSWHNRLGLLLGYQPRDVEVSTRKVVGVLPHYRSDAPTGHLHTTTLRAFEELAAVHGFERLRTTGGAWPTRSVPTVVAAIDRVLARRPALARRFFYLGRKRPEAG